jgi:hypothetical protein
MGQLSIDPDLIDDVDSSSVSYSGDTSPPSNAIPLNLVMSSMGPFDWCDCFLTADREKKKTLFGRLNEDWKWIDPVTHQVVSRASLRQILADERKRVCLDFKNLRHYDVDSVNQLGRRDEVTSARHDGPWNGRKWDDAFTRRLHDPRKL